MKKSGSNDLFKKNPAQLAFETVVIQKLCHDVCHIPAVWLLG